MGRPIKYRTETEPIEARRKRQREYYVAHRETIAVERGALFRVPQTAGKAIEPGAFFIIDTATRESAADDLSLSTCMGGSRGGWSNWGERRGRKPRRPERENPRAAFPRTRRLARGHSCVLPVYWCQGEWSAHQPLCNPARR